MTQEKYTLVIDMEMMKIFIVYAGGYFDRFDFAGKSYFLLKLNMVAPFN